MKFDSFDFEVWKSLICGLLVSDFEILCVKVFVEFMMEENFDYLELFLNVGGVLVVLNLLKNFLLSEELKIFVFLVLLNFVRYDVGKE